MVIRRKFDRCLITPDMVTPSHDDFRVVGTFNPGVVASGDMTYLLVRVAEMPKEKREGRIAIPRVEDGNIVLDWQKQENVNVIDERLLTFKPGNFLRLTNISHLRLAKSRDGINIDSIDEFPTIFPEGPYEEFGIEDARITPIGDMFYITYVGVSRHGITVALVSTEDFVSFKRHGIIFTTNNKDVVLFPEKIRGRYTAFHRPLGSTPFHHPEIWIAYSPDLMHWGDHYAVTGGDSYWGSMKVGAGPPPIRTEEGWLEIYHGSHKAHEKDTVGVYSAGAALFDLDNPRKLIGISQDPILVPEMDYETLRPGSIYEKDGFLPNIVFPSGIVRKDDELFVYCGAADTYTTVSKLSLQDVLGTINRV